MLWLLAAGFLLLGPTPDSIQAQERLKEGQQLMSSEKFEEAAQAFREAIALDPAPGHGALRPRPGAHGAEAVPVGGDRLSRRARGLPEARRRTITTGGWRTTPPARTGSAPSRTRSARAGAAGDRHRSRRAADRHAAGSTHRGNGRSRSRRCSSRKEWIRSLPTLPPGLPLALGSAYFRSGQLADAEREYRAALVLKPEAGRAPEQPRGGPAPHGPCRRRRRSSWRSAEKSGFRVSAGLKKDVEAALAAGSNTPRP